MPTWPSANKASNQYTDQGTDRLADARAEIDKTITNVNTVIDTFNITSPNDGDLLQYSSSSGQWEPIASSGILNPTSLFTLSSVFNTTQVNFVEILDAGSRISVTSGASSGTLTIAQGKYILNHVESFNGSQNFPSSYTLTSGTASLYAEDGFGTGYVTVTTTTATFTFTSSGTASGTKYIFLTYIGN